MRSVWSCSSCAILLLVAVVGRGAEASHAGPKRDVVHRVPKAQITPGPLLRREASTCGSDQSLCPETLGGGCCPSRYECATDSCYATTAGQTSACGKKGWFACNAADSGGCCPVGYVCGPTDCTAPAGVSNTFTSCPFNYHLCPASFNYGCCMDGMGCALNACYSTIPVTTTITQKITTTVDGSTITSTQTAVTVATPSPPSGLPATDAPNVAPKFIPTAVSKVSATAVPASASGGLTSTQLGGIIGGVVALLVIVLAASFLIIRRLNRVHHAVEAKSQSQKSQSQDAPQSGGGATQTNQLYGYIDDTSGDPLMLTGTTPGGGTPGAGTPPHPRGRIGSKDYSNSPTRAGFSPDGRHTSIDSSAPGGYGYFDIPRVHNVPGGRTSGMTTAGAGGMRSSVDSYSTQGQAYPYGYHHQRQQSNASELSDGSDGLQRVQELDSSGAYVELPTTEEVLPDGGRGSSMSVRGSGVVSPVVRSRANSGVSGVGVGSPRVGFGGGGGAQGGMRRRSESGSGTGIGIGMGLGVGVGGGRGESPAPPVFGGPLDVVSESVEIMHGYYGPRDRQVGQTAAGLGEVGWDVSSPLVGFVAPEQRQREGEGNGGGLPPPPPSSVGGGVQQQQPGSQG